MMRNRMSEFLCQQVNRSMLLVIGAVSFVIANVTCIRNYVSTAIFAFALSFSVESFLVRSSVLASVGHTISDSLVRRALM